MRVDAPEPAQLVKLISLLKIPYYRAYAYINPVIALCSVKEAADAYDADRRT
jgi:hypothetical protein